jgi:hypothetical protein
VLSDSARQTGLFAGVVASFLIDARHDLQENSEQNLLSDIRAGLFAGIVSSFVINAHPDLLTNPEQNILNDIQNSLQKMSVATEIPVSQKWINALWFLSLYITLFSAIMGVLAKAWLAKFVPATTKREATAAYERYKLDKQARRRRLDEVITFIPFLVQIAAFLFLSGLVIQTVNDDQTLGDTLLSFCVVGCAIYLTITFLPFVVRQSPFNTPLTEILFWFGHMLRRKQHAEPHFKTNINDGLAEILYENLIKSPKPKHVDEAAAEISLPSFKKKWIEYLCKTDTPRHLLIRFQKYASTRPTKVTDSERNDTLCNHLLAFLQFVDLLEEKLVEASLKGAPAKSELLVYQPLFDNLLQSLGPGFPLYRWNNVPESLRPLLFGLRTQVLTTLGAWPKLDGEFKSSTTLKLDFYPEETSERPWELAFQDITSSHRLHFMLAACRGVLQGEGNVKRTSTFILGLALAKGKSTLRIRVGRMLINTKPQLAGLHQKQGV